MNRAGIILIIVGVLLIIVPGFIVPVQENLVKLGPLEINQTKHNYFGWPNYTGIALLLIGIILVLVNRKK